ncbi:AmpG family muropeptide MFS transporter [Pseudomarimonas arenosa]|uniref:MFS transporter n=1 Tax=Pseudomarimonas arenosa TaxID=2774145 RepID=A0AAW3ZPB1_9GAMM|nr:MFS transporter [Pseudomarimonas arenosa]MBD8527019.1 MFS transporter [Pseudomarimonas arenosa]
MSTERSPGWKLVLNALGQPKVAVMLAFGFAAGLPFMLVGNTLGYWLREAEIDLATIGFLSWAGLAYSAKMLWAPIVDKTDIPWLGRRLGRRRGWIVLAQVLVAVGLLGMAWLQPQGGLIAFAVLAVIAAFASATQDIVIDAWRIESAQSSEELALLSTAYQLGYRTALLLTDALILVLAAYLSWSVSYALMAALMAIGLIAALKAREPGGIDAHRGEPMLWTRRGLFDALIGPFVAFFRRHRQWALLMLATISLYRLADFVMGPMANPMYADLGFHKEVVGSIRGSAGLIATLVGTAAAGLLAVRLGFIKTLLIGAVLGPASNLAYAWLALSGVDLAVFTAAMVIDNFSAGFAGIALIAYMSSLTSIGYTATQYALLSSFYALIGKVGKGFSGAVVEWLAQGRSLFEAYALFFVGTALIGIPAVLACVALVWQRPPEVPAQAG